MEYIFFIVLVLQLFLALQITKDLLHPVVVLKTVWALSCGVLIVFKDIWNVSLSIETILIFITGIVCFDLGFIFFNIIKNNKKNIKVKNSLNQLSVTMSYKKSICLLVLIWLTGLYIFYLCVQLVGISPEFLIDLRYIMKRSDIDTSFIQFTIRVMEIIGVSYILIYIRDKTKLVKREKRVYILIILSSLLMLLLSTGRYRYLSILVALIYVYYIKQRKNDKFLNFNKQYNLFKRLLIVGVLFIFFFQYFGQNLVGKGTGDLFSHLAIYISSGLVAFNMKWQDISNTSSYFGESLFAPIYTVLDILFGIKPESTTSLLSTVYGDGGFATNVFTFYRQQIVDFGVIGIPFVMFFLGLFFAFLKFKSIREKEMGFWTALYAFYMFGIITSPFQDAFFLNSTYTYLSIFTFFLIFKTPILTSFKTKK